MSAFNSKKAESQIAAESDLDLSALQQVSQAELNPSDEDLEQEVTANIEEEAMIVKMGIGEVEREFPILEEQSRNNNSTVDKEAFQTKAVASTTRSDVNE